MTARTEQHTPTIAAGEQRQSSISQQEKSKRWDCLIGMLSKPEIRNSQVRQISALRRAVMLLLARREELPTSLTAELKSYMVTLEELYLEVIDGFADVEGIINFLPMYITESLVGELCQGDSPDDELSSVTSHSNIPSR